MRYVRTEAEKQSGLDRVRHAEGLISQLPPNHDGRNSWLLNYGTGDEAEALRKARGIAFHKHSMAAATTTRS